MNCKICKGSTTLIFNALVLEQHDVAYYFCNECDFIQTEEPYWLLQAYQDAVSIYDVWSVARPIANSEIVSRIIDQYFPKSNLPFLDYGGGSGIFVRRMRDIGFDFIRSDAFSKNLFARCFDITDFPNQNQFGLVTSFEVFEHLPNPLDDVNALFKLSNSIFFTTSIKPSIVLNPKDWDYIAPYHGQHVSFYSVKALHKLAELTGSKLLTDGKSIHLLTKENVSYDNEKFINVIHNYRSGILNKGLFWLGKKIIPRRTVRVL